MRPPKSTFPALLMLLLLSACDTATNSKQQKTAQNQSMLSRTNAQWQADSIRKAKNICEDKYPTSNQKPSH